MSRESQLVDEAVSIFDVARRYNLPWADDIGRPRQVLCPMHAENNPSCRVYPKSNSAYCWTCQKSFGPTGLVVALEGVGWTRATEMLAHWYHIDLTPDPDEEEAQRLIRLASGHGGAVADPEDLAEQRRYAAMSRRCVGLSWADTVHQLDRYDQLDLTDVTPAEWVGSSSTEGLALQ